jgi:hypothetical protein
MLQVLFEQPNSFFRPLKKKGFKEERVTTMGLYAIGKSHDPGIQQEPASKAVLQAQIEQCIVEWNQSAHPFHWSTKSVAKIMADAPAQGA